MFYCVFVCEGGEGVCEGGERMRENDASHVWVVNQWCKDYRPTSVLHIAHIIIIIAVNAKLLIINHTITIQHICTVIII